MGCQPRLPTDHGMMRDSQFGQFGQFGQWAPLVNLGLPRTGTTSFACAVRALGLNPLHNNQYLTDVKGTDVPRVASWIPISRSVWRPDPLVRWFDDALSGSETRLLQFDALADIPFCCSYTDLPVRVRVARFAPRATFVCTERTDVSWASSMMRHGYAGASYVATRYNLSLPYRNQSLLQMAKRQHALQECAGVPQLRMDWPSEKLWAVLCNLVPPHGRRRCAEAQNWTWPQHVQANPLHKAVSRQGTRCAFT